MKKATRTGLARQESILLWLFVSGMKGISMESMTTFDSTKESLLDLLQSVKQRSEEHTSELQSRTSAI
jgi:hypothetical protein